MSNFWAYLKTRQFRNTVLLVIATVISIVLIAFFSLSSYTRHGQGIPVPSLKGLNVDRAMDRLKEQGFNFKIDSVYVPDQAPGTIVEQDPDAGTNVKENRTIYLTMVTQQAPPVSLPDLITEQSIYREAVATLSNYGLKVGDTTYRSDIARDRVLEVRFGGLVIKPGTKIPKGSKLDLVLGNGAGASEVDIPDLVNLDLDAARFAVKGAGLTMGTITYQGTITDSTNVVVVSQIPARTDSLSKTSIGTRVNLTVSQSKPISDAPAN
ncbi:MULTISPECIES: PASTA domain-containing protein [unclassified Mucilaginibacter]|uniref:PASTA domain-containing protein n=1 Tax=unclassified Mucilaginibacter TaxID=2617802 RepID=UPI00138DCE30|nr:MULTISPECIES: PASTA domain-containing protein [unclassified Mucilaginibacter]MBB5394111.1 beta-lactam-binding protein with PASTA domain [Mucilaginibacter sp. AK015]QHS57488.1 PASTA domain-containing protein [Mucilaginibacter sp. 14171R-50]